VALLFELGSRAILGVLKARKIYVPMAPSDPPARIAYMLEDSQATLIVTNRQNVALARALASEILPVITMTTWTRASLPRIPPSPFRLTPLPTSCIPPDQQVSQRGCSTVTVMYYITSWGLPTNFVSVLRTARRSSDRMVSMGPSGISLGPCSMARLSFRSTSKQKG
jgi:acyl-CoA synthetase (AMP-forming)/AMP-acid ligase II